MNQSGHDAIVGLDLNLAPYAKIRWVTRDCAALRTEHLFCSYNPSATLRAPCPRAFAKRAGVRAAARHF